MGYTHYWTFEEGINEKAYAIALRECRRIIKASPVPLGNAFGRGKPKLNNGVWINGVDEDSHETFALDREPSGSDFCKTARRPYDIVVVACLCVLEDRLGSEFHARSDGDPHEWEDGKTLAAKVLKRDIKIPQDVIDQTNKCGWWARMYRKEHPEYKYTPLDMSHPNHKDETIPDYAKESA